MECMCLWGVVLRPASLALSLPQTASDLAVLDYASFLPQDVISWASGSPQVVGPNPFPQASAHWTCTVT